MEDLWDEFFEAEERVKRLKRVPPEKLRDRLNEARTLINDALYVDPDRGIPEVEEVRTFPPEETVRQIRAKLFIVNRIATALRARELVMNPPTWN